MSLSAHLLESYEAALKPVFQPPAPAHGRPYIPLQRPPHLSIPQHSTPFPRANNSVRSMDPNETWTSHHGLGGGGQSQTFMTNGGASQWSEERIHMLQARLAKKLGPEFVTQRPGPGGGPKLSYIEGWKVINLANEVFGFNGWSSSIVSLTTDFLETNEQGRTSVNITAIVRITLQDGCFHEDVGCGQGENIKGKGAALDKAKKEAVTDATKRALKTFGNVLGNCLYDKEYTKEVAKMKVPPAKFNREELERRPEFTEAGAAGPSRTTVIPPQTVNPPKPAGVSTNMIPSNLRPAARESPPAPGPRTPLRSISDRQGADYVDESFDAEFMGMGSDSFLDQLDERTFQINGAGLNSSESTAPADPPVQAGPKPPAVDQQPTYHHRHRPDPPAPPAVAQLPYGQPQAQQRNHFAHPPTRSSMPPEAGPSRPAAIAETRDRPSSGESSMTMVEPPKPRVRGGFGLTAPNPTTNANNTSNTAGMTARAKAIASAFLDTTAPASPTTPAIQAIQPAPIRAESPRIPSGGINEVAAKASQSYRAHAQRLELDENDVGAGAYVSRSGASGVGEMGGEGDYGAAGIATGAAGVGGADGYIQTTSTGYVGFASARGVKRSSDTEERMSASPTKPGSGSGAQPSHRQQPHREQQGLQGQQYQYHRPLAPRRALGELPLGEAQDWGAKRSRVG